MNVVNTTASQQASEMAFARSDHWHQRYVVRMRHCSHTQQGATDIGDVIDVTVLTPRWQWRDDVATGNTPTAS